MTASKCIWLQVQVICELEKVVSSIKYGSAGTSHVKAHRTAVALDQITWSLFREQNEKDTMRISFALDLQIILPSNKQGTTSPLSQHITTTN